MNVIEEIKRINEVELQNGTVNTNASWHTQYAKSAWVFIGGLDSKLTEGDVICIMSQYGEVEDINLVREESTGDSKGFCFLKYEDARSCVLAVDNMSGSQVLERSLRVDHVEHYRLPKHLQEKEEELASIPIHKGAGHAYQQAELASEFDIHAGHDLFALPSSSSSKNNAAEPKRKGEHNSEKKEKDDSKGAKQARKEERDRIRREKERRHEEREEKRREKRALKMSSREDDRDSKSYSRKKSRTRDGESGSRHHRSSSSHQRRRSSRSPSFEPERDGRSREDRNKRRDDNESHSRRRRREESDSRRRWH
jgi:RNA-binding motif X-linked protein 2